MNAVLPHIVAFFNALSAVLLVIGFGLIRSERRDLHRTVMTAAVISSCLFLAAYLLHHFTAPVFVFPGHGLVRPLYFTMLVSHVALSAVVTPMVAITFLRARRGVFERHRALARWTLPIWLYVSVTGLGVYVMLYLVYGVTA